MNKGSITNPPTRYYQMDVVRYILALAVIIAHFNLVFDADIYWPISSGTAVGIFFGFSGFLVYASYLRHNNMKDYVMSRAKRILPAYVLVVVGSAILLSALSTLGIVQYYTDHTFWKYLGANLLFLNFLQPELPGVFEENVVPAVNGSLWTLKVEWMLYLSLPLIISACRKFRIRMLFAIVMLFLFSVAYKNLMEYLSIRTNNELYSRLSYQFAGQFVYFYAGVLCYTYRHLFLAHKWLFFCLGAALLGIYYGTENRMSNGTAKDISLDLLYPIAITIFFLSVSLPNVITSKIKVLGNCSYEMYLFHFPILQSLYCSSGFCSLPKGMMLGICLVLTYVTAYLVHGLTDYYWKRHQVQSPAGNPQDTTA